MLRAQPVPVRHSQGELHGFLTLSSMDGAILAEGDDKQTVRAGRVTSRLTFHFKDGSLQDETTVYSQNGHFHLLSDRLIQKGPAFPRQMDLTVDGSTGVATARYTEHDGKEKTETARLKLPPDLANGLVPVLLANLKAGTDLTASMVVAAPKPQLVKLAIHLEGTDPFSTGGAERKSNRYVVKIEIGGIKGVVAPLVGKQPPDTRVWMLGGTAPAFLRAEGASCEGCAIWRTELVSPRWTGSATVGSAERKK